MRINKIVIVGGGSSGWMTAAGLCRNFEDLSITLIESKNIKTMGVGESTLGQFNSFLRLIRLDKDDYWMKEVDGTYKISIKFTDFREKNSVFHYPFGHHNADQLPRGLDCWPLLRQINPEYNTLDKFAQFYHPFVHLAENGKMTFNEDESLIGFNFKSDTAYHIDAIKFGIFLRDKICIPEGVHHVVDEVSDIKRKENGDIDYILSESGLKLEADLFIDCTGFKSLLLEETMESKFISFNETLINDRALAAKVNYDDIETEMENVTNCTAIENGWVWNIPLWNRIGTGYCYSSKFVSREQAEIEFRNHLKKNGKTLPDDYEFNEINIRHGKREKGWVGNVLGIGLSYGFIEPLESTGLLTTHENIYKLVKTLERRDRWICGLDKAIYNRWLSDLLDGCRSFIEMHYALSMRDDTEYWKHVTNIEYLNDYDVHQLQVGVVMHSNFNGLIGGMPYIAAGMGYLPTYVLGDGKPGSGTISPEEVNYFNDVNKQFMMYTDQIKAYVDTLPTHYQFLKKHIYT